MPAAQARQCTVYAMQQKPWAAAWGSASETRRRRRIRLDCVGLQGRHSCCRTKIELRQDLRGNQVSPLDYIMGERYQYTLNSALHRERADDGGALALWRW